MKKYMDKADVMLSELKAAAVDVATKDAIEAGLVEYVKDEVYDEYLKNVKAQQANAGICKGADLKVVYTPLNGAGNKLVMFDPSLDPKLPYTIVGGVIGIAFFRVAQYTTDHEFVQRQLTAKDVKKAGSSLIYSQLICLPLVIMFIGIGSLLFVLYKNNPDFDALGRSFFTDARDVFPQFIKNHIPAGVRGLMIVGLLAAALSSFNSAINAMASSFVSDLYLPIKKDRGHSIEGNADQLTSSRKMVILMGAILTGFAIVTAVMQQSSGLNLVDFATGIMCFAYAGMIGVFLTAIFTKRGNTASVLAAIIVGALIIIPLMFQKQFFGQTYIAWCWWCPIGGIISTLICLAGKPKKQQA